MPLQPRGPQDIRKANSRVPMTGEERAASFLAHARQARSNKLAGGSTDATTKGQERRLKLMQFRDVAPVAKSVAHQGVVERPMDEGLSKILERKRAELKERGTSVARVNRHEALEAQADALSPDTSEESSVWERESPRPEDRVLDELQAANASSEGGTSVAKFKSAKKEMKLQNTLRRPPSLGDMEI
jgi:hypothetical protein